MWMGSPWASCPCLLVGSWARIGNDLLHSQECTEELQRHRLDLIAPFEDPDVLAQILLVHSAKDAEEVPNTGPDPFHRIVMHLTHPIPVVIAGPLPLARCVTHRGVLPSQLGEVV